MNKRKFLFFSMKSPEGEQSFAIPRSSIVSLQTDIPIGQFPGLAPGVLGIFLYEGNAYPLLSPNGSYLPASDIGVIILVKGKDELSITGYALPKRVRPEFKEDESSLPSGVIMIDECVQEHYYDNVA